MRHPVLCDIMASSKEDVEILQQMSQLNVVYSDAFDGKT